MTLRMAEHAMHERFLPDPAFCCLMEDADERCVILVTRGPLVGVPASHGGWAVRTVDVASVRHDIDCGEVTNLDLCDH